MPFLSDTMLASGFVAATFVPWVLFQMYVIAVEEVDVAIHILRCSLGENHLRAVWRLSLGLNVIPAFGVFVWRWSMEEPTMYKKDCMARAKIPYFLIFKRYWVQLAAISIIWCLYDLSFYPFNIYSSTIINRSVFSLLINMCMTNAYSTLRIST